MQKEQIINSDHNEKDNRKEQNLKIKTEYALI
jgi:hypothetical protein